MAHSFSASQPSLQIIPYIRPPSAKYYALPTFKVSKTKRPQPATASAQRTFQTAVPSARHKLSSAGAQTPRLAPSKHPRPPPSERRSRGASPDRPIVVPDVPSGASLANIESLEDQDTEDEVPSVNELVRRRLASLRRGQNVTLAPPAPGADSSSVHPAQPLTRATSLPAVKAAAAIDDQVSPHCRAGSVSSLLGTDHRLDRARTASNVNVQPHLLSYSKAAAVRSMQQGSTPTSPAHDSSALEAKEESSKPGPQTQPPMEVDARPAPSAPPANALIGFDYGTAAAAASSPRVPEIPESDYEDEPSAIESDDKSRPPGSAHSTAATDVNASKRTRPSRSRPQVDSSKFAADTAWEVDYIVGKRKRKSKGKKQSKTQTQTDPDEPEYLVQWSESWVRESLLDCSDLIHDYEKRSAQVECVRRAGRKGDT